MDFSRIKIYSILSIIDAFLWWRDLESKASVLGTDSNCLDAMPVKVKGSRKNNIEAFICA